MALWFLIKGVRQFFEKSLNTKVTKHALSLLKRTQRGRRYGFALFSFVTFASFVFKKSLRILMRSL